MDGNSDAYAGKQEKLPSLSASLAIFVAKVDNGTNLPNTLREVCVNATIALIELFVKLSVAQLLV